MKILTLNTHSLLGNDCEADLRAFVEGLLREKPDIVALQEVNQTAGSDLMPTGKLEGQYPIPGSVRVLQDNFAAQAAYLLRQAGVDCWWAWLPIKLGYGKFDEGVAILSLGRKIRAMDKFPISKTMDYNSWRTRAVLGVQLEGLDDWFYTVHMGWWEDMAESFLDQWKVLNCCIASKRMCERIWLMGDFNAPDTIRGQSYDHIVACGWYDTYKIAACKDSGITVPGAIDGWREKRKEKDPEGMRLDYIWCSRKREILSSRVVFNGTKESKVSDHYGVMIEVKENKL